MQLEPEVNISAVSDDRERAEEEALALRKSRLDELVRKRKHNIEYLVNIHKGNQIFMNSVILSVLDMMRYNDNVEPSRTLSLYYLSMGISKLLGSSNIDLQVIFHLSKLLDEWEYYTSSFSVQSMKYMLAKQSETAFPQLVVGQNTTIDSGQNGLWKFSNDILFEHFSAPNIPFSLDQSEILLSLCHELSKLYDIFISLNCYM